MNFVLNVIVMMHRFENLSVIIGTSSRAEGLRRHLRKSGFVNLGVAMSVAGLRREMIMGENHLTIACLLLDEQTLQSRGEALKQLIADSNNFNSDFRCIGLVIDPSLLPISLQLGCHCYVRDQHGVAPTIHRLTTHWRKTERFSRFPVTRNDGGHHRPLDRRRQFSPPSGAFLPIRRFDFPVDQQDLLEPDS
ncbi:MAG: hypothetical protein IH891_10935 [Planctomycetes bacterium]|nr:hypothetical protein [Planctomycetota bacterium]